ncbi:MAG: helix-turn-helix domain-containing protein [Mediterranea sp.]|nr:helix-turn-helix domain-containing protein [Mediterranea sp.]
MNRISALALSSSPFAIADMSLWEEIGLALILLIFCIIFLLENRHCRLRKKFRRLEEQVTSHIMSHPPIVLDERDDKSIYCFAGLTLNMETHVLVSATGANLVTLTPHSAMLLRAFILTDNHLLSLEEIERCLWTDGSGNDARARRAISRLKGELKCTKNLENKCLPGGRYQLVALNKKDSAKQTVSSQNIDI